MAKKLLDTEVVEKINEVWKTHTFRYKDGSCSCGAKVRSSDYDLHVDIEIFRAGMAAGKED